MNKIKFDYNDLNNFLPDNKTVGTSSYYKKKLGYKLPEYMYDMMEINARKEYNHSDVLQAQSDIKILKQNYNNQLLNELNERSKENNPLFIELKQYFINKNNIL